MFVAIRTRITSDVSSSEANQDFKLKQSQDCTFKLESLILAQNERWRRALHMQVERGGQLAAQSSGERVSNAWIICLQVGDNPGKLGLIPHNISGSKGAGSLCSSNLEARSSRGAQMRCARRESDEAYGNVRRGGSSERNKADGPLC